MSTRLTSGIRSLLGGASARANPFGLVTAIVGLVVGWLVATAAVNLWPHAPHRPSLFVQDLLNLAGLWLGFIGAVLCARAVAGSRSEIDTAQVRGQDRGGFFARLRLDYGIAIRPVDLLAGIVIGLVGQYALTPLLELPLLPFVPHLFVRLNDPAKSLTAGITGAHFVILGFFVCLGSPVVEELYFRGLVLRALLGQFGALSRQRALKGCAVVLPVVADGIIFGLVHFEPLELLALAGFGMVLALLAVSTGRLGPSFVAHVTFNSATFIALARTH